MVQIFHAITSKKPPRAERTRWVKPAWRRHTRRTPDIPAASGRAAKGVVGRKDRLATRGLGRLRLFRGRKPVSLQQSCCQDLKLELAADRDSFPPAVYGSTMDAQRPGKGRLATVVGNGLLFSHDGIGLTCLTSHVKRSALGDFF